MLGQELMGVLYRDYSVPTAAGRYVDMGMSFKGTANASPVITRKGRCKPGELRDYVATLVSTRWQSAKDIAVLAERTPEGVRTALETLTKLGTIESNGIKGMKQYRLPREKK